MTDDRSADRVTGQGGAPRCAHRSRRRFFGVLAALGVGATALPGALWAHLQAEGDLDTEAIAAAERVAGLELTPEEREMLLEGVSEYRDAYRAVRELQLGNDVPPALVFDPVIPGVNPWVPGPERVPRTSRRSPVDLPSDEDDVAFLSVADLGDLLRRRQIGSEELTRLYLRRLDRFDPMLRCVITPCERAALEQARRADRELAAGTWRGPLHGIPWGAKDLLATRDYPTTWGATPYRDQVIYEDATVVRRLEDAGAVLVAKLALGALAWGDVWFDGRTRNPWNPEQGSSGSSAGPASATAAALVGFAIGSETLGSIVSPSVRCGVASLRPTFGRVSRHGAMALSWSMDKLGPMCRGTEDCALVMHSIHGDDGLDPAARQIPFDWDPDFDIRELRIGYLASAFERDDDEYTTRAQDHAVLSALADLGVDPTPVQMPDFPISALSTILDVEAATAFDELTLSNRDDLLVRQVKNAWPNANCQARFVPAVEYLQANRARTELMRRFDQATREIDVLVTPPYASGILLTTNLTGHPAVVMPHGFRDDGTPVGITFVGAIDADAPALAVAHAVECSGVIDRRRPDLEEFLKRHAASTNGDVPGESDV